MAEVVKRIMQAQKLTELLNLIQNAAPENRELTAEVLKLAVNAAAFEAVAALNGQRGIHVATPRNNKDRQTEDRTAGVISFTKKELNSMPKSFKKAFIVDNKLVKFCVYNGMFRARYRRDGYNIEVASKNYETMKKKFIKKLTEQTQAREAKANEPSRRTAQTVLFADYAAEWLAIKEQTTKPSTYKEYVRMFKADLLPKFGAMHLADITRSLIQEYLFTFVKAEKYRTAEKLKLMLNCIFDMAAEDFSMPSPMKKIVLPYHESKKGSALTKEEERNLVEYCKSRKDDVASALLVLLYFGLRQSELPTIKILEGDMLECLTSKERMGRDVTPRKIPFTPMFKKVHSLVDFEEAKSVNIYKLRSAFKRLFPNHHPHELRYTFITRCKECGVNHELVMLWDGHSFDKDVKTSAVDRGYTDYSTEYILSEAGKVNYDL